MSKAASLRAGRIVKSLIEIYTNLLRPFMLPTCRYLPSCSAYAGEAIAKHGLIRGSMMAVKRIFRCHPWNEGGADPVQ